MTYAALFLVGTLLSGYLIAFAYKNTKFTLKHKIAQKREAAISKEVVLYSYNYGIGLFHVLPPCAKV